MQKVIATNTHYIVPNYDLGDCPRLEKYVSVYNDITHAYEPLYSYDPEERTLRLPRGVDEYKVARDLNREIDYDRVIGGRSIKVGMTLSPRNIKQKAAIRFLIGKEEYSHTRNSSQLVLSLPSGGGKTYCAVSAISLIGLATLVVTHNDDIRKQWRDRLLEYTDIPETSIVMLNSSAVMHSYHQRKRGMTKKISGEYVYIVTHSLLRSYMKTYGSEALQALIDRLGIGIKIVDECHKEFYNTILLDNSIMVYKNFYLTATFGRNDPIEDTVYQRVFNSLFKLVVPEDDMGVQHNVMYITNIVNSRASEIDIAGMYNIIGRGTKTNKFNVCKYIDYAVDNGTIVKTVMSWVDRLKNIDGMVLIVSPKISSNEYFCDLIKKAYPNKKCAVHGSSSKVDNMDNYDIVCATSKIIGTGNDITRLKAIINVEPIGSEKNAYQLFHRLMRGNDSEKRWYIEVVDKAVPNCYNMYRRTRQKLEESALEHYVYDESKKK